MKAVLENIEKVLKSKRQDKHARYVALDIVRQTLKQIEPKKEQPVQSVSKKLPPEMQLKYNQLAHNIKFRIISALQSGQLITAVKEYRAATGTGLKEAKDTIELHPDLKRYTDERLRLQERNFQLFKQQKRETPFETPF